LGDFFQTSGHSACNTGVLITTLKRFIVPVQGTLREREKERERERKREKERERERKREKERERERERERESHVQDNEGRLARW
jgi:hypothetical protein